MRVTYDYLNWRVEIVDNLVTFTCTLEKEPDAPEFKREYDLPEYYEVLMQAEYIYLMDSEESMIWCIKLEGESCLVIDNWVNTDEPEVVGTWDFYDEVE